MSQLFSSYFPAILLFPAHQLPWAVDSFRSPACDMKLNPCRSGGSNGSKPDQYPDIPDEI